MSQNRLNSGNQGCRRKDHNPRVGGSSPSSGIARSRLCKAIYCATRIASGDLEISKRSRNGPETFEALLLFPWVM